jgi:hypothetical protein
MSNSDCNEKPKHFSDKDAVAHLRRSFQDLGRKYTEKELFNLPDSRTTVGLLHLILDECKSHVREQRNYVDAHLEAQQVWLTEGLPEMKRDLTILGEHLGRISKFCRLNLLPGLYILSLTDLGAAFRRDYVNAKFNHDRPLNFWYWHLRKHYQDSIDILEKLKSLKNLELLEGIGPKTAAKIRKAMEATS